MSNSFVLLVNYNYNHLFTEIKCYITNMQIIIIDGNTKTWIGGCTQHICTLQIGHVTSKCVKWIFHNTRMIDISWLNSRTFHQPRPSTWHLQDTYRTQFAGLLSGWNPSIRTTCSTRYPVPGNQSALHQYSLPLPRDGVGVLSTRSMDRQEQLSDRRY
jgi:hypothetical protein